MGILTSRIQQNGDNLFKFLIVNSKDLMSKWRNPNSCSSGGCCAAAAVWRLEPRWRNVGWFQVSMLRVWLWGNCVIIPLIFGCQLYASHSDSAQYKPNIMLDMHFWYIMESALNDTSWKVILKSISNCWILNSSSLPNSSPTTALTPSDPRIPDQFIDGV